jgi:hypothetical protein
MARPKLDYKKICRDQEIEIMQLKSSLGVYKKVNDELHDKREKWERQAVKFSGVIDYLEEKLEEQKEHQQGEKK